MSNANKKQDQILSKLGIEKLKPMQEEAILAISSASEVVLLSPTGTGKTLAFLLPIIEALDPNESEVQALIIVPSRELAIQIEQVSRSMGAGFKINEVYGGRSFNSDRINLKHRPALLIGTPGRVADHLRRRTFPTNKIKTLVLDEFDKSLEVGFEDEMREIIESLYDIEKKVLTSATYGVDIPNFVRLVNPVQVNFLEEGSDSKLTIKKIMSPTKDKLETLVQALCHFGNQPGIIFCNFKNSIQRISDHLTDNNIEHGCFYGGMEQKDRERALIKFRNGSHQLIIATDLASRGIDVPEIKFIIHYHLPMRKLEFVHRNGRTARMHNDGNAYILQWEDEHLPDFITASDVVKVELAEHPSPSPWQTIFISGGRQDKISKGDIAGVFFKQGNLEKDDVGIIELKQDCAFVAVKRDKVVGLIALLDNTRIKKKKVRLKLV